MLIRFLSNQVEQHVENSVGRALIAGGLAEEVKKPAPPPPVPVWTVCLDPSGYVAIKCELGKLAPSAENPQGSAPKIVQWYQGDPATIHNRKYADGTPYSSAFGRPVPEEVVDSYRRARRDPAVVRQESKTTDDYNKEMAATLAVANRKAFKPVIPEREALQRDVAPFPFLPDPSES